MHLECQHLPAETGGRALDAQRQWLGTASYAHVEMQKTHALEVLSGVPSFGSGYFSCDNAFLNVSYSGRPDPQADSGYLSAVTPNQACHCT